MLSTLQRQQKHAQLEKDPLTLPASSYNTDTISRSTKYYTNTVRHFICAQLSPEIVVQMIDHISIYHEYGNQQMRNEHFISALNLYQDALNIQQELYRAQYSSTNTKFDIDIQKHDQYLYRLSILALNILQIHSLKNNFQSALKYYNIINWCSKNTIDRDIKNIIKQIIAQNTKWLEQFYETVDEQQGAIKSPIDSPIVRDLTPYNLESRTIADQLHQIDSDEWYSSDSLSE